MLEHVGRRTGAKHCTVLEVVDHDQASGSCVVVSGWGPAADWFRNVQKTPAVTVWVGRRRFPAVAAQMEVSEAEATLRSYARRNPRAFRQLARLMAGGPVGDPAEICRRAAKRVPLVRFVPQPSGGA